MAAKTTARKWIKMCVLGILAAFLLYLTAESAFFVELDYGRWKVNRWNVQDRLYESISMFYFSIQLLVLAASLLALTVLLVLLLFLIGRDLHTIRTTVETCEVPAVELEHHRCGQLGIAAEISFLAALISLVSGIKGRKSAAAERSTA